MSSKLMNLKYIRGRLVSDTLSLWRKGQREKVKESQQLLGATHNHPSAFCRADSKSDLLGTVLLPKLILLFQRSRSRSI